MRGIFVVSSVTGEESNGDIVVLKDGYGCRWKTPGCLRIDSCNGNIAIKRL